MTRSSRPDCGPTASGARWRGRLLPGLLAIALAFPSAAYPFTLEQLLRLPLVRLLQLEFSPRRVAQADAARTQLAAIQPAAGGRHVA